MSAVRVVVVEDETFTRRLVEEALRNLQFEVRGCASVREALRLVDEFEPHAVITDLDLGEAASGLDLLSRLSEDAPWIGQVVLTAHASPALAAQGNLPEGAIYLVKSRIAELSELGDAIQRAIEGESARLVDSSDSEPYYELSSTQAEVLRMIADGLTNGAIAEARGTSRRAVENLVQRVFRSLDLNREDGHSPRIEAVRIWRQGRVRVRS